MGGKKLKGALVPQVKLVQTPLPTMSNYVEHQSKEGPNLRYP